MEFPHAECIIKVTRKSKTTKKKSTEAAAKKKKKKKGKSSDKQTQSARKKNEPEVSYYISSIPPDKLTCGQWMAIIRNHWGGIEIKNHWRKDACLLEDATRSREPNIVAAMAMLRNCYLHFYEEQDEYDSLPALTEAVAANSNMALRMIMGRF